MSEYVQALELRISDNASEAAGGLTQLADTLRDIKTKISRGFGDGLDKVATHLETFHTKVGAIASEDNVTRLNKLAEALERICNATKGMSAVRGLTSAVRQVTSGGTAQSGSSRDDFGLRSIEGRTEEVVDDLRDAAAITKGDLADAFLDSNDKLGMMIMRVETLKEKLGEMLSKPADKRNDDAIARLGMQIKTLEDKIAEARRQEQYALSHEAPNFTVSGYGIDEEKEKIDGLTSSYRALTEAEKEAIREQYGKHGRIPDLENYQGRGAVMFSNTGMVTEKPNIMEYDEALEKVDKLIETQTELDRVRQKIDMLREALAKDIQGGISKDEINKRIAAIQKLIAQMEKLEAKRGPLNAEAEAQAAAKAAEEQARAQAEAVNNARTYVDELANGKTQAELTQMKLEGQKDALAQDIANNKLSTQQIAERAMQIQHLENKLREMNAEGEKTGSWLTKLEGDARYKLETVRASFNKVKDAIFRANGGMFGFFSGMMRVAKYRLFRSLIREITEGFSTGLENVRKYSKAIDGLYNKDMSGLDNSLLKMKNSLGAAVAPAIQALIPLFQRLTQWVITASNYVNQFFALLNGASTWTRAIDVNAEELENMDKAAKGASKSVNNLLAAWDELNIIQSQSGGGGSGLDDEDLTKYTKMFEESESFDERIRNLIQFLEGHLPYVDGALAGIAARLLGFSVPAAITIAGVVTSFDEGKEAGENNESFKTAMANALPGMIGTALGGAAVGFTAAPPGMKLEGALIGFGIGAAIGVAATFIGWVEGDKEASVDTMSFIKLMPHYLVNILGSTIAGAAIGWTVGGSLHGAIIGGSIGAAIGIYTATVNYEKDNKGDPKTILEESFAEHLLNNVAGISGAAVAGLMLGVKYGGQAGGVAGFIVGATIAIVASYIEYQKKQTAARLFWVALLTSQMQADWGASHYNVNIDLAVSVKKARVEEVEQARVKIENAARTLEDTYVVWLSTGLADDDDSKGAFDEAVKGFCEAASERAKTEGNFVKLTFGVVMDDGTYELSELGSTLESGIQLENTIIQDVGKEIGRILAEGTAEEYSTVIPKLRQILQEFSTIEARTQAQTQYDIATLNAEDLLYYTGEDGKKYTDAQHLAAYIQAHNEAIEPVREAAKQTVNAQMSMALRMAEEFEWARDNPDMWVGTELESRYGGYDLEAKAAAERAAYNELHDNYAKYVQDEIDAIIGDDKLYKDTVQNAIRKLNDMTLDNALSFAEGIMPEFANAAKEQYRYPIYGGHSREENLNAVYRTYGNRERYDEEIERYGEDAVAKMGETILYEQDAFNYINGQIKLFAETFSDYFKLDGTTEDGMNRLEYKISEGEEGFETAVLLASEFIEYITNQGKIYDEVIANAKKQNTHARTVSDLASQYHWDDVATEIYEYLLNAENATDVDFEPLVNYFVNKMIDEIPYLENHPEWQEWMESDASVEPGNGLIRYFEDVQTLTTNATDAFTEFMNNFLNTFTDGGGAGEADGRGRYGHMQIAGAGYTMSGVSFGSGNYIETNYGIVNGSSAPSVESEKDEEDEQNLLELLRETRTSNNYLKRIAEKEWTFGASSGLGSVVKKSLAMAEKVYGY